MNVVRKLCLDWKVLVGLAAAGLGIVLFDRHLLSAALPLLLVAACPLSMLLMMRGMGSMHGDKGSSSPDNIGQLDTVDLTRDEQLAALKEHLARLQVESDHIASQINRLQDASNSISPQTERAREDVCRPTAMPSGMSQGG